MLSLKTAQQHPWAVLTGLNKRISIEALKQVPIGTKLTLIDISYMGGDTDLNGDQMRHIELVKEPYIDENSEQLMIKVKLFMSGRHHYDNLIQTFNVLDWLFFKGWYDVTESVTIRQEFTGH